MSRALTLKYLQKRRPLTTVSEYWTTNKVRGGKQKDEGFLRQEWEVGT
jgi:hypothetical protein